MGKDSKIDWTHHTFNPWRGCAKVSEGCKNCYAETSAPVRVSRARGLELWGAHAHRQIASEAMWREPLRWNREAEQAGERRRVFCASLADVFEDRTPRLGSGFSDDLREPRQRLWELIRDTPHLDWLLLTKRPENVLRFVPDHWRAHEPGRGAVDAWPRNVWIGCTVENQDRAQERLPHLLHIPARVRFVSYEPALEAVDFGPYLPLVFRRGLASPVVLPARGGVRGIDWIIVGGESGPGARPFNPAWADRIVSQCKEARVPVFVKQMGSNPTLRSGSGWGPITDRKGGDWSEWSAQLRVRQVPEFKQIAQAQEPG